MTDVVLPDGRNLNHELVTAGLAWWRRQYAPGDKTLASLRPSFAFGRRAHHRHDPLLHGLRQVTPRAENYLKTGWHLLLPMIPCHTMVINPRGRSVLVLSGKCQTPLF